MRDRRQGIGITGKVPLRPAARRVEADLRDTEPHASQPGRRSRPWSVIAQSSFQRVTPRHFAMVVAPARRNTLTARLLIVASALGAERERTLEGFSRIVACSQSRPFSIAQSFWAAEASLERAVRFAARPVIA